MKPPFFKTQHEFRKWLEQNHKTETELLVGFYKVGSGEKSLKSKIFSLTSFCTCMGIPFDPIRELIIG